MTTQVSGRPTVLIVDDDDPFARTVREQLATAGYFVQRAASGQEALGGLASANANLILLNLLLPDTDGLILCASLRARTDAPIVVLSQRPRGVDRVLALEVGAIDVLTVPMELDALLSRLDAVMEPRASISRAAGG
jgi:two-component system response regulator RegX3